MLAQDEVTLLQELEVKPIYEEVEDELPEAMTSLLPVCGYV